MKPFLVLRNGWIEVSLPDIQKGERFRANLPAVPGSDNNPIGEDIFTAASNPVQEGTIWTIAIEKPDQNRWATPYIDALSDLGVYIQVRGVTTNETLDYRTVTG